ncbi:hypothetical protein IWZ01DRAFT_557582 [Phyllosticta capitalensis]
MGPTLTRTRQHNRPHAVNAEPTTRQPCSPLDYIKKTQYRLPSVGDIRHRQVMHIFNRRRLQASAVQSAGPSLYVANSIPTSGLRFVDNSKGALQAVKEVADVLDETFKQIEFEGIDQSARLRILALTASKAVPVNSLNNTRRVSMERLRVTQTRLSTVVVAKKVGTGELIASTVTGIGLTFREAKEQLQILYQSLGSVPPALTTLPMP